MPTKQPLVSVVIVNWNGLDDTKECLRHLKNQTYKNFETIVVDNGSVDQSVKYFRTLKDISLVENPKNLGFTGGHITGFRVSRGDFVLLLNNDAIMDEDYLRLAVDEMLGDPKIGALGGRAYLWDDANPLFSTENKFYAYQNINPITAEGIFSQHDAGEIQEVNNVSGSCVMVSRAAINEVGYLHDPFFAYFEESDFFARLKRAGYKVMYSPNLAIWHANAKTSSKKAPTYSLYMMMRNRFRFAVRNFDGWSLRRFLYFYLKMGVASIVKSLLPVDQRPMHKAYAKAFFYNLIFGFKPFVERWGLIKKLGPSDYNQRIVREQTGVSMIAECQDQRSLDNLIKTSGRLLPIDEILVITSNQKVQERIRGMPKPGKLKVCFDRGFFKRPGVNLGAVCARNDWLVISQGSLTGNVAIKLINNLYFAKRSGSRLIIAAEQKTDQAEKILKNKVSKEFVINRQLFIEAGGIGGDQANGNSYRQLALYAFMVKGLFSIKLSNASDTLPAHPKQVAEVIEDTKYRIKLSRHDNRQPSWLYILASRHYRLAQVLTLISWLFTLRIPARLKLARIKNLLIGAVTLNSKNLAIELKHMRNEVIAYRYGISSVKLKKSEMQRLNYMTEHPAETPIFIILRDRIDSLRRLLSWLESQKLSKIIFIDNDSLYPPLLKFLEETPYQVLELSHNMTQTAPWSAGIIKLLVPDDFYVVTDPDILPTIDTPEVLKYLYQVHQRFPYHLKVGLGLKIDDLPNSFPLKKEVTAWEAQFWKKETELAPNLFEAGVDTTFALYKPRTFKYLLHPSIRTGYPYIAKHLPWYTKSDDLTDEEVFYRLRADQAVNSWNKNQLPERYKKELEKQGWKG